MGAKRRYSACLMLVFVVLPQIGVTSHEIKLISIYSTCVHVVLLLVCAQVLFDKITSRISKLAYGLADVVDPV